jgi:glyoxylase-like metal-dependent hydrolase (beta-lactamase superfamily II)
VLKWKIGEVTVTRHVEMEVPLPSRMLMPGCDPDAVREMAWLKPFFVDGPETLRMSIHALVVDTPTHRIVVDTCTGNDKPRPAAHIHKGLQTAFLTDMEASGFSRESVDIVLCTHLHVDHVGWNTMLVDGKWVPTFPNARYLIGRTEFDYWRDQDEGDAPLIFADSVKPIFDDGLVDLVEVDHRINDAVSLVSTPGHTPGHVSVRIRSKGQEAFITGDMVHHPVQLAHPDWATAFDSDMQRSSQTRRDQFDHLAGQPVLVIGTHFAEPTAGHIVRDGDAYRLED